jgi:hypothetical protein
MAFELANDRRDPEVSLVTEINILRLDPSVLVHYGEVARVMEPPVEVLAVEGNVVTIDAAGAQFLGRTLEKANGTSVGVASAAAGDTVTIPNGSLVDVGDTLTTQGLTAIGTPDHAPVPGGRRWSIRMPATHPKLAELMGAAYVEAGMYLLAALGATVQVQDVVAAVTALGQQGVNIDTFLARQGEALEQHRRTQGIPGVFVEGSAPAAPPLPQEAWPELPSEGGFVSPEPPVIPEGDSGETESPGIPGPWS